MLTWLGDKLLSMMICVSNDDMVGDKLLSMMICVSNDDMVGG